jgi:hypothetical protein
LVQLEDCVLECIIAISEGMPREEAMHTLYSKISSLKNDLASDDNAMSWFNLYSDVPPTPAPSEIPSTPFLGSGDLPLRFQKNLEGQWC